MTESDVHPNWSLAEDNKVPHPPLASATMLLLILPTKCSMPFKFSLSLSDDMQRFEDRHLCAVSDSAPFQLAPVVKANTPAEAAMLQMDRLDCGLGAEAFWGVPLLIESCDFDHDR